LSNGFGCTVSSNGFGNIVEVIVGAPLFGEVVARLRERTGGSEMAVVAEEQTLEKGSSNAQLSSESTPDD